MTVSQGESLRVEDSMVKAAIERGQFELAQTFIMAQQLDAMRRIRDELTVLNQSRSERFAFA